MRRGFSVDRSGRTRRGLRGLNRERRPASWRDHLSDIPLAAFEDIITLDAKDLTARPTFKVAYRALGRELLEHLHEVMPGDRAHTIMEAAIAAA
jgi:hypothetical protein